MVLQIAAVYGHDPADPLRAAEALVIQGRHADVEAATKAIREALSRPTTSAAAGIWTAAKEALAQLPSMLGVHLRARRNARPFDRIVATAQCVSYWYR